MTTSAPTPATLFSLTWLSPGTNSHDLIAIGVPSSARAVSYSQAVERR
jgi:hypothetical protein